jgi:release factor glutamine methyltransferase
MSTRLGAVGTDGPGPCGAPVETVRIGPVDVAYDATVLEPRPWTVLQAQWAAEVGESLPGGPLLELCTGAGHIGLAAAVLSGRGAVLVDASPHACRFAAQNAERAGIAERVEVRRADLAAALGADERFPLVLADPPYIPSADTGRWPEDPLPAIDGGDDGLTVARLCLSVAGRHVAPAGAVVLQLRDASQAELLTPDAVASGLRLDQVRAEPSGRGVLALLRPLSAREGRGAPAVAAPAR